MRQFLTDGLQLARRQTFAIGVTFFFHFIWSLLFYQFIQRHVVAVMQRFPPDLLGTARTDLFINESALLLFETNLARPFLWTLFILVLVRVLVTPFLTAGVYDSLHTLGPRGTIFIQGIRRLSGAFTVLFWLRCLLTAIPLYWILPASIRAISVADSYLSLALGIAPFLLIMMGYSSLLKLIFIYLQLAKTTNASLLMALRISFIHLLPISGLAFIIFCIALLCSLLVFTSSLYWAGFLTIIIYLSYPLLQMAFEVWGISVQYRFWEVKRI